MSKGIKTDEKIINVAVDLFAGQGYHNTSIRQITDRLNITNPAIYAHFKSKAEIGRRVIKLWEVSYVDRLIEIVDVKEGNAADKIHATISWSGEFGAKNLKLMIAYLSFRKDLLNNPEFELALTETRIKHEKVMTDLFRAGIREGVFKKHLDPNVLTSLYLAVSRGMFHEWSESRNKLSGREFIRTLRTVFFKGIEAP